MHYLYLIYILSLIFSYVYNLKLKKICTPKNQASRMNQKSKDQTSNQNEDNLKEQNILHKIQDNNQNNLQNLKIANSKSEDGNGLTL